MSRASPVTPHAERKLDVHQVVAELVAAGHIAAGQQKRVLSRCADAEPRHPLVLLADCEIADAKEPTRKLTLDWLAHFMADRAGLPFYRIDPLSIDVPKITAVMSYAYATRWNILAVKVTSGEVTIATSEPFLRDWERDVEHIVNRKVRRVVANPVDLQRYLVEFYALARSIKASEAEKGRGTGAPATQNLEQLMELGRAGKLDANDQHIVNIVDWLLQYAFDQRASDIHLEPRRDTGNVRFRIDGMLHEVYQIPATVMAAVNSRLKILARLDLAEKRRPQDGRIKTRSPNGREVELRVSSLPTAFGEKLVMRIFDPDVLVKDFTALGFAPDDVRKWNAMIREPHGIVLVTGPTGSGKTTTLYSTLKQLATPDVNVCTIEDPIELVEPAFNQMQVQPQIDISFAGGVRALLRQDPDIIMIGEVRDLETAQIAVQAALTGHLVLSTLHTNDAPSAITRLMDLGSEPYLLRATVLGIVAQRLVRRLCSHCKRASATDEAAWQKMTEGWKVTMPAQVHQAVGCLECRETGYLGRLGIYEILMLSPPIKQLLTDNVDLPRVRELAYRDGMVPLRISGARKVAEGSTTIEEVLSTTPAPRPH